MFFKRKAIDLEARRLIDALEERLALLEDKHVRLRGKVYAHNLHKESSANDQDPDAALAALPREQRKAVLLQRAGFQPGKPMAHREK